MEFEGTAYLFIAAAIQDNYAIANVMEMYGCGVKICVSSSLGKRHRIFWGVGWYEM